MKLSAPLLLALVTGTVTLRVARQRKGDISHRSHGSLQSALWTEISIGLANTSTSPPLGPASLHHSYKFDTASAPTLNSHALRIALRCKANYGSPAEHNSSCDPWAPGVIHSLRRDTDDHAPSFWTHEIANERAEQTISKVVASYKTPSSVTPIIPGNDHPAHQRQSACPSGRHSSSYHSLGQCFPGRCHPGHDRVCSLYAQDTRSSWAASHGACLHGAVEATSLQHRPLFSQCTGLAASNDMRSLTTQSGVAHVKSTTLGISELCRPYVYANVTPSWRRGNGKLIHASPYHTMSLQKSTQTSCLEYLQSSMRATQLARLHLDAFKDRHLFCLGALLYGAALSSTEATLLAALSCLSGARAENQTHGALRSPEETADTATQMLLYLRKHVADITRWVIYLLLLTASFLADRLVNSEDRHNFLWLSASVSAGLWAIFHNVDVGQTKYRYAPLSTWTGLQIRYLVKESNAASTPYRYVGCISVAIAATGGMFMLFGAAWSELLIEWGPLVTTSMNVVLVWCWPPTKKDQDQNELPRYQIPLNDFRAGPNHASGDGSSSPALGSATGQDGLPIEGLHRRPTHEDTSSLDTVSLLSSSLEDNNGAASPGGHGTSTRFFSTALFPARKLWHWVGTAVYPQENDIPNGRGPA